MDDFARESLGEQSAVFAETSAQMGVTPVIAEKDFWVCWTLKRVFTLPDCPAQLIFKGGTSLSKAYGVIQRFSEDIDLSIRRSDLGFSGQRDPANLEIGNKARKQLLDELSQEAETFVSSVLRPKLQNAIATSLQHQQFELTIDKSDRQTLLFSYPSSYRGAQTSIGYVKPTVRLEFGARSDHEPAEQRNIEPYVNEIFPTLLSSPQFSLPVLSVERTFWEKATILHMLAHGGVDRPLADRMSRHYYDFAMLASSEFADAARKNTALLETVAAHKQVFFRAAWAKYDTARVGSLQLLPPDLLVQKLSHDYAAMSEMLFGPQITFSEIMNTIFQEQQKINAT